MVKIAEEQAVHAEVLGATSSLVDNGVLNITDVDTLNNFVKVASDIMLETGYNTPEELASGIIEIYKEASELAYENEDMEPEDYEEDAEDAEEDTVAKVLKEASDIDEAFNMCVDLTESGHLSMGTMDKVASAYDSGELAELLYQTKLEKVAGIKDIVGSVGGKLKGVAGSVGGKLKGAAGATKNKVQGAYSAGREKWNSLSTGKKIGIGAGAAGLTGAGIGGTIYYKKRKKENQE